MNLPGDAAVVAEVVNLDCSSKQESDLGDRKTREIARILASRMSFRPSRVLVVGCGSGVEAAILASTLQAQVTGVDLHSEFDARAAARATLQKADATSLPFADQSFDLVYSYHALEHIPLYRVALQEMRRVLVDNGYFCVGTPNRLRLLGYLGSKDASLMQKIQWNMIDWRAMLRGRFRNECGAHAGFSTKELDGDLRAVFSHVNDITLPYYHAIYPNKTNLVNRLHASGLWQYLFPSIYFFGAK